MKKIIYTLLLFVLAFNIVGFAQGRKKSKKKKVKSKTTQVKATPKPVQKPLSIEEKKLIADGYFRAKVIDNSKIDGCGYVLKLEDHSTLEPMGLDTAYQKNGKEIWIKFNMVKNRMSTCMAGQAVNILDVKVL